MPLRTWSVFCLKISIDSSTVNALFRPSNQNEGYLLKQLKDFKSGARIDSIMATLVTPLTDADMADLAAYYAIQKVSKGVVMQGANLALGQKIYRGGKTTLEK
jgi:cytochrome c553